MKRKWWMAVVSLLAAVLFCCMGTKMEAAAASLKTIASEDELREESRYIIYSGNTQTAMYDSGGSQEGWLQKDTYDASRQLNPLCKFWWDIEKGDGGIYLINVGTGYPVKGQGKEVSGYNYVVSDRGDGSTKGMYILEAVSGGFKLKSSVDGKYMTYGADRNYVTFTENAEEAAVWKIDEVHSKLDGSKYLWKSHTANNYYRIPAIATANNGDLVASADIRYANNSDLGNGKRIDLVVKTSEDQGVTWSAESNNITTGHGASNYGYGDPAIVADRDSDKVLILCATGSAGYGGSIRGADMAGVNALLSHDNGKTFEDPVDLTEQIYNLKQSWQGLFVASGRIMQSRYVKTGDYYRLYCSVLTRTSAGFDTNAIYILYSDDFGSNWKILGGPDSSPVVGGDEAKLEETPDGSVVVSSRKHSNANLHGKGRYINVFTYESGDSSFTKGSWAEKGTATIAQQTQGTNGEMLVLYVKDQASSEYKYLMLHSVPTIGTGRNGVGIYYKELGTADSQVSNFVSGWDYQNKFYMVQEGQSGYSTMSLQKNGKIAFFYEDSPTWYDLVYIDLDLETITGGKYSLAFAEGIGSAATPYQVSEKAQAEAVFGIYEKEGVHWSFTGEGLTFVKEKLEAEKEAAEALLESERLTEEQPETGLLQEAADRAEAAIGESTDNGIYAVYQELLAAMEAYEQAEPAPAMVEGLEAAAGNAQVVLTWTAQTGTITGYEVSKDGGNSWEAASPQNSHTFTGLENDKEYTFAVRAVNGDLKGRVAEITAVPFMETVMAPVFSLENGTYEKGQEVEISSETEGAEIYFTLDGAVPTADSTKYEEAILLEETVTIRAIAIKEGMKDSQVTEASYVVEKEEEIKDKPWIFTDVSEKDSWKYDSVKFVYNRGIMADVGGSKKFMPNEPLSRSMFTTVLYRMAGEPEVAYQNVFSDVPAGTWFTNSVLWAYEQGLASGVEGGVKFDVDSNISREQIAKILYLYAKNICGYDVSNRADLTNFTDYEQVSHWATEYMQWAVAESMISGKPNDEGKTSYRMDPKEKATRAECAAMLMRFINAYEGK